MHCVHPNTLENTENEQVKNIPSAANSALISTYLDVLCKRIKDLLGDCQSFREIVLSRFINDVLSRVVPIEIADGLLKANSRV